MSLRDIIRVALDDERMTVDAIVTKRHADTLADELANVLTDLGINCWGGQAHMASHQKWIATRQTELADAWDQGYTFAFYQERGYNPEECYKQGVPEHLTWPDPDTDGPSDMQRWNPYR